MTQDHCLSNDNCSEDFYCDPGYSLCVPCDVTCRSPHVDCHLFCPDFSRGDYHTSSVPNNPNVHTSIEKQSTYTRTTFVTVILVLLILSLLLNIILVLRSKMTCKKIRSAPPARWCDIEMQPVRKDPNVHVTHDDPGTVSNTDPSEQETNIDQLDRGGPSRSRSSTESKEHIGPLEPKRSKRNRTQSESNPDSKHSLSHQRHASEPKFTTKIAESETETDETASLLQTAPVQVHNSPRDRRIEKGSERSINAPADVQDVAPPGDRKSVTSDRVQMRPEQPNINNGNNENTSLKEALPSANLETVNSPQHLPNPEELTETPGEAGESQPLSRPSIHEPQLQLTENNMDPELVLRKPTNGPHNSLEEAQGQRNGSQYVGNGSREGSNGSSYHSNGLYDRSSKPLLASAVNRNNKNVTAKNTAIASTKTISLENFESTHVNDEIHKRRHRSEHVGQPKPTNIKQGAQPNLEILSKTAQPNLTNLSQGAQPNLTNPSQGAQPDLTNLSQNVQPNVASPNPGARPKLTNLLQGAQPNLTSHNQEAQPKLTNLSQGYKPNLTSPNQGVKSNLTNPSQGAKADLVDLTHRADTSLINMNQVAEPIAMNSTQGDDLSLVDLAQDGDSGQTSLHTPDVQNLDTSRVSNVQESLPPSSSLIVDGSQEDPKEVDEERRAEKMRDLAERRRREEQILDAISGPSWVMEINHGSDQDVIVVSVTDLVTTDFALSELVQMTGEPACRFRIVRARSQHL